MAAARADAGSPLFTKHMARKKAERDTVLDDNRVILHLAY